LRALHADIDCQAADLTTRNEFHNGKAQKKAKRWIDPDLLPGIPCIQLDDAAATVAVISEAFHSLLA
jgi:hypothetical protein